MLLKGIVILLLIAAVIYFLYESNFDVPSPEEHAGKKGEIFATNMIKQYLYEEDLLFTNIEISYDGREAELDNVIVNKYGVFIIEVKNYTGELVGEENDFQWEQYHVSYERYTYQKSVKNPIKQVKRQIYILAKYLEYYGINVWVEGYVYFINNNSPLESEFVVSLPEDFSRIIHTSSKNRLTRKDIDNIARLFS